MAPRSTLLATVALSSLIGSVGILADPCPIERPLSVGIVPQQAPSDLARVWIPLLDAVSETSGCIFRFATAPNIPEFEQRLARGQYDIAYMNPYHYRVFHQSPGYQAFAREKGRRLRGLIVSKRGGGARSEQWLQGKQVAFPSPAAFAATIIPLAELEKAGIHVEPVFVASHDSVYLNVARGFYPAGGGIERTFQALSPTLRDRLEVIWRSRDYPPHAFAALPTLDRRITRGFLDAFNQVAATAAGEALLRTIQFQDLERATDADWDSIRALEIDVIKPSPPKAKQSPG